jgi:hypothetical protein
MFSSIRSFVTFPFFPCNKPLRSWPVRISKNLDGGSVKEVIKREKNSQHIIVGSRRERFSEVVQLSRSCMELYV